MGDPRTNDVVSLIEDVGFHFFAIASRLGFPVPALGSRFGEDMYSGCDRNGRRPTLSTHPWGLAAVVQSQAVEVVVRHVPQSRRDAAGEAVAATQVQVRQIGQVSPLWRYCARQPVVPQVHGHQAGQVSQLRGYLAPQRVAFE